MQRVMRSGIQWLVHAADDGEACRRTWEDNPRLPYLLPVGRAFDLLALGQEVGLEALDQLRRRRLPLGPVLIDRAAQQVGFLLPPGSQDCFARAMEREAPLRPDYRYCGEGSFVVIPGPQALTGDRYEWLNPPGESLLLTPDRTAALAVMFAASARLIERAKHYGEEASDVS